jgi:SprB repeat
MKNVFLPLAAKETLLNFTNVSVGKSLHKQFAFVFRLLSLISALSKLRSVGSNLESGLILQTFRQRFRQPHYRLILALSVMFGFGSLHGQTTFTTGSFIINMGITPQTVNNGLKPYGMVYDLVKNHKVPVHWVINQSKIMDGTDFTHNGINYKGGPFVVPKEYRTAAVNARITYWTGQGVVGATTVAPITVPVLTILKAMPSWTLDADNGGIAQDFLTRALIPATAYNWLKPGQLTCCNDLFAMPHADPTWPTHGNLDQWNLNCDGAIWLGCHAGSAEENLFNPANKAQQLNFLSQKTGIATGGGPYAENALVLWGNHTDGTPPYTYQYPTDPMMQFMGILDAATQNGSEQIFLPKLGWNPGAKVYVYDPTHSQVPSLSPGPAAVLVSGRAMDNPLRGRVMLEAAHDIGKASAPANIAAQRAFFNFSYFSANEKAVIPSISAIPDTMYSGIGATISFVLPPGKLASDYTIVWSSTCGGTFTTTNTQTTTFTPPPAVFPTQCFVSVSITDACGRVFIDNKTIVIGCGMKVTPTLVNPGCSGVGSISMAITNGVAPYSWNWSRVSPAGTSSGSGTTITGLSAGTYNVTVTATGGCTATFQSVLTASPAVIAVATPTAAACFGAASGSINVAVSGGTAPFGFNWGGGIVTQNRSNVAAGTYTVTVTDAAGCTATAAATVTQPADMTVSLTPVPVPCFGQSTGSITSTVTGGTGSKTYVWNTGATTANLTNVAAGTYSVTVTDANNCKKTASATVTQPASALSLSATSIDATCGNSNGSINLTPTGGTPAYTYVWSNGATTQDISGLAAGNYTVTVTDSKGCTAILSKMITAISPFTLSVQITNSTCPTPGTGAIDLTVTGGTAPFNYDWADVAGTSNSQDRTALVPGTYTVTVTDGSGCVASISGIITALQPFPQVPPTINH